MGPVGDVVSLLATIALLCISMVMRPTHARCPIGWYVNGVRPSGGFQCLRAPTGDPDYDGTWGHPDRTIDHPGDLRGRIYCTGGATPIVVDDRAVGCMR